MKNSKVLTDDESELLVDNPSSLAEDGSVREINDCRLFVLPPGELDADIIMPGHLLDVNLGNASAKMAYNSDRLVDTPMLPNSIALFRKDANLRIQTDNPLPGCLIEVGDETLKEWLGSSDIDFSDDSPFTGYLQDLVASDLARTAIQFVGTNPNTDGYFEKLTLEALVLGLGSRLMAAMSAKGGDTQEELESWSRRANARKLQRAMNFANDHLSDPSLSVTEMAKVAELSSAHFSTIFKAHTGESAYAYILRLRTQLAKDMIVGTKDPLAVVAYKSGFSNQAHMSSTIKKYYGMTPGDLRKR